MNLTPPGWDNVVQERINEICKALVRMGPMTYPQLGRLLRFRPTSHYAQVRQIVKHGWQSLRMVPYKSTFRSVRYPIGSTRMKHMVRLTEEAAVEWVRKEGLRSVTYIRPQHIGRMLNVADIFVHLRMRGVIYGEWDMMLPQMKEGLHATFRRNQDGITLGMYLLPLEFTKEENTKLRVIHQGIIRKVTQNLAKQSSMFFLVPAKNYALTLDILTKQKFLPPGIHLLPLESFMADSAYFLHSLAEGEAGPHAEVWPYLNIAEVVEGHDTTTGHPTLVRMREGGYRYIDTYTNGDVRRMIHWSTSRKFYATELAGTGAVPRASVYVYDQVMLDGVTQLLSKQEDLLTDVYPWPSPLPRFYVAPITEDAEDDWSIFNHAFSSGNSE